MFACVASISCGHYYTTMNQPPIAVPAVATAPAVFFYAPWFGQLARPEAYTDDASWQRDVAQIQTEWLEQVPAYADDEGVASRVFTLPTNLPVPAGAIGVQITVVGLRDDYNAMTGGFLYLTADLRFVDSSGAILFDSRVEATSKVSGAFMGYRGMAIDGRIAFATWNLITVAMKVIKTGRIEPSQE
jgi:hypothetical protein